MCLYHDRLDFEASWRTTRSASMTSAIIPPRCLPIIFSWLASGGSQEPTPRRHPGETESKTGAGLNRGASAGRRVQFGPVSLDEGRSQRGARAKGKALQGMTGFSWHGLRFFLGPRVAEPRKGRAKPIRLRQAWQKKPPRKAARRQQSDRNPQGVVSLLRVVARFLICPSRASYPSPTPGNPLPSKEMSHRGRWL